MSNWLGNILDPRSSDADAQRELERIQTVLAELALVRPGGAITDESLVALRAQFSRRAVALGARRGGVPIAPAAAVATLDAPSGDLEAPGQRRARGPSLQEFLADRSILIVSYLGAFLLVA